MNSQEWQELDGQSFGQGSKVFYTTEYYGTHLGTFSSQSALLGAVFRFFSHGAFKLNKYIPRYTERAPEWTSPLSRVFT